MIADTLNLVKEMAAKSALDLRARAPKLTGTEIIDEEDYVPAWRNEKDYSNAPVGTPVKDEGQIYTLLQPHNASYYPNTRPKDIPALWRVKHTTNPARAKPYVKPTGTSDMYMKDECMIWEDGLVYKSLRDTVYSPTEYAADWERVE